MNFQEIPIGLQFLFIVFCVILAIQIFYYLFIFRKLAVYKSTKNVLKLPKISVIICAKNEANNITENLPFIIHQDYPTFEILVIDDASSDNSLEILNAFAKEFKHIKIVKVKNNEAFWGNKKFALTLGIKAATHNHLLFIDADCKPTSPKWIEEIAQQYTQEKTVILGYGAYSKIKNSLVNQFIRFETMLTAIQYFSWSLAGKPYMGVGRNMAYHRDEFFKADGFIKHIKIRSGDDDLFINEVANKKNTTLTIQPNSFTTSEPKHTWNEWFTQKRRHISTAKYYKNFDKFQLGLFFASQFLFIVLSVILAIFFPIWQLIVGLIVFRYIFTWIIVAKNALKLHENDLILGYPFYEIGLVLIQIGLFIKNIFSKPVLWK